MNRVELIGRITKNPELQSTTSGKSVVSFTLAVQRDKDNADFINCTAWGKTAELISNYTGKGTLIGVEGRIQTSSYDNNNGGKTYVTRVNVENVTFCESKPREEKVETPQFEPFLELNSEELPF